MRGKGSRNPGINLSESEKSGENLGKSPRVFNILDIPVRKVSRKGLPALYTFNTFDQKHRDLTGFMHGREQGPTVKRGVEGWVHSAQHDLFNRVYKGFLLVLSNLSSFLLREPEQLCAHLPNNCHTFEDFKALGSPFSHINLRVEPRAMLRRNGRRYADTQCGRVCSMVYPGWV